MFAEMPNYLKLAMLAALLVVVASAVFLVQKIVSSVNAPPPLSLIVVEAFNEGADAATTAESIGKPIEQQLLNNANVIYFYSTSTRDGEYSLTVAINENSSSKEPWQTVSQCVEAAKDQLPPSASDTLNISKADNNIVGVISTGEATPDLPFLQELEAIEGVSKIQIKSADTPNKDFSLKYGFEPGTINKINGAPCSYVIVYQLDRDTENKCVKKIKHMLNDKNKADSSPAPYTLYDATDKKEQ